MAALLATYNLRVSCDSSSYKAMSMP